MEEAPEQKGVLRAFWETIIKPLHMALRIVNELRAYDLYIDKYIRESDELERPAMEAVIKIANERHGIKSRGDIMQEVDTIEGNMVMLDRRDLVNRPKGALSEDKIGLDDTIASVKRLRVIEEYFMSIIRSFTEIAIDRERSRSK